MSNNITWNTWKSETNQIFWVRSDWMIKLENKTGRRCWICGLAWSPFHSRWTEQVPLCTGHGIGLGLSQWGLQQVLLRDATGKLNIYEITGATNRAEVVLQDIPDFSRLNHGIFLGFFESGHGKALLASVWSNPLPSSRLIIVLSGGKFSPLQREPVQSAKWYV